MRKVLILLSTLIILMTGCKNKAENHINLSDKAGREQSTVEQPVDGGTLTANITPVDTLNPFLNTNERVKQILNLSMEGLTSIDKNLRPIPALAAKWDINGTNIKFYLKKDIKWQDGLPFTANDVRFTFDILKDKTVTSPYKDILVNYISSYRLNGDYEFEITLKKPVANPAALFTFPIMAEHQYKNKDDVINKELVPIGTGPYKILSYHINREIVFERNDYFTGTRPHLDKIIFKIVPDDSAAMTSFKSREVDLSFLSDIDWDKYKENPDVGIYKYTTQNYILIAPNYKNEVLNDVNVRKAISYSIDTNKILKEVYFNHGLISRIPIRPDSWVYGNEIYDYNFDYNMADKILNDSGWQLTGGIRTKQINSKTYTLKFNMLVNVDDADMVKIANIISDDLKNTGIEANIVPVKWADLLNAIYNGKFDLALMQWHLSYNQDLSLELMTKADNNFMSYSNSDIDVVYNKIFAATGEKALKNDYAILEKAMMDNQPFIGLFYIDNAIIAYNNVRGINPTSFNIFNGIENWYIKK